MRCAKEVITQAIEHWISNIVIGLNLCPFAAKPFKAGQVKIIVVEFKSVEQVLRQVRKEIELLIPDDSVDNDIAGARHGGMQSQPLRPETTLVAISDGLHDFMQYLDCANKVERAIKRNGWEGEVQLATFHPQYCFADAKPMDSSNLTNRAPYPIFHLLKEDSVEQALMHYPHVDLIPQNNINTVSGLTENEKDKLFHYLLNGKNHG